MSITAAQGGSVSNGLLLRVIVLTGAAAAQIGGTGKQTGLAAHEATLTTTVTGSRVYLALTNGGFVSYTAAASTTLIDNSGDATNGEIYGSGRATALTGTPGTVTVGSSAPSTQSGGCAAAEILPAGLLWEDASGPAPAQTSSGTTVTTASFAPPPGALLVALIGSDGGSGVTTMAVSGGGLTWTPLAEANDPGQDYAGVWISQAPSPDPGDPVITAAQGGATAPGMLMRIKVLTGAAPVQNGATASASASALSGIQKAITTTVTGSQVYGALVKSGATAFTANGSTTFTGLDNFSDSVHGEQYATCRTAAATGTPGAVTVGASLPSPADGSIALAEILPAGTLAEDASSPAVVTSTSATTVSSVNFTPPPGSLLVAMISADGGAGVTTMSVSGGGLAWAELARADASGLDYAGVWIARVTAPVPAPLVSQYGGRF
jgi:hypothetical protein